MLTMTTVTARYCSSLTACIVARQTREYIRSTHRAVSWHTEQKTGTNLLAYELNERDRRACVLLGREISLNGCRRDGIEFHNAVCTFGFSIVAARWYSSPPPLWSTARRSLTPCCNKWTYYPIHVANVLFSRIAVLRRCGRLLYTDG